MSEDRTQIDTVKVTYPQIYAYTHPNEAEDEGWIKIGETIREDAEKRIAEQNKQASKHFDYNILWTEPSKFKCKDEWFHDKDFHRYLTRVRDVEQRIWNDGSVSEWFYYNGHPEASHAHFEDFVNGDFTQSKGENDYQLREEQERAVQETCAYFKRHKNSKFLWNAKPRFGKTLTTYDLALKMGAKNVLIVTNRPAIANSWMDDFEKFIAWKTPETAFVSETSALKQRNSLSFNEFSKMMKDGKFEGMFAFLSLQDLKGGEFFGGKHQKLEWVADTAWDLLVIDESHEGVDTVKTDVAFNQIEAKNKLYLSGTPFKALASGDFSQDQIFNWTYVDEQTAKQEWDASSEANNPYETLPTINMFTFQMSDMLAGELEYGADLGEAKVNFAFDLFEFFSCKTSGKFVHEEDVEKWLWTLATNEKFPFSTPELRGELKHTLWVLDRVDSCKALKKLLEQNAIFGNGNYEIVLAAGNGRDDADDESTNTKSYDKVKEAIARSDKTITLTCGQLTTGVTIPEWTAVLMLSNMKSPQSYMQAAFRAQNPHTFNDPKNKNARLQKKNAYVFDFAPERTLELYDTFANGLDEKTANGHGTTQERKENLKRLLNFFPVIAERDGKMQEIDAEQVLTIPRSIKATQVVRRGFMCNYLFANISGIFKEEYREIINKLEPVAVGEVVGRPTEEDVNTNGVELDEHGNVVVDEQIVINRQQALFGAKVFDNAIDAFVDSFSNEGADPAKVIQEQVENVVGEALKSENLGKQASNKIARVAGDKIAREIEVTQQQFNIDNAKAKVQLKREIADAKLDEKAIEEARKRYAHNFKQNHEKFFYEATNTLSEKLPEIEYETAKSVVEMGENAKKKKSEDDTRARLRGFARTVPSFLMAYGDENTCLANFDEIVDADVFEEVTGITVKDFRVLRDEGHFFDEVVFNEACREFLNRREQLGNYFESTATEDIFDYIPPQKTNQIFTPRPVVTKMLDLLEAENPGIFEDPTKTFADLYVKSGLYLTEIAKRLFRGLEEVIPDEHARLAHIFENQLFGFAPTPIIFNIAKNFIFGFEGTENLDTSHLYQLDLTTFAKGEKQLHDLPGGTPMKFDCIVGNPPYQEADSGGASSDSANPVYQNFVNLAIETEPNSFCLIMPSKWMIGGKAVLNSFREEMVEDKRILAIYDHEDSSEFFDGLHIDGGVCYLMWQRDFDNSEVGVDYHYFTKDGEELNSRRSLKSNFSKYVIRDERPLSFIEKASKGERFSDIVSRRKPYGIATDLFNNPERYPESKISAEPFKNSLKIYGVKGIKGGARRVSAYVSQDFVSNNEEAIDKYKLYFSISYSTGAINPPKTIEAEPNEICTETFLIIGPFDNRAERDNCHKYMQTKFFKLLLFCGKGTMHVSKDVFDLVPLQDFTPQSDIDWTAPIANIDRQLYAKYALDSHEVEFIEEKVRGME